MITEAQREQRRNYIGSSDASAILGVDPYRSAADVWLDKTGRLDGDGGNANTERGNLLEPAVIAFAEKELGRTFQRSESFTHKSGLLIANLDAFDPQQHEIVEAKTTVLADEWGEEGTDQVPDRVLVQAHHQFACLEPCWRVCWVPVLMPGFRSFEFRMYRIERNDELAEMVGSQGADFMTRYVKTNTPPEDFKPSMDVIRRVRREPEKIVSIDAALIQAWRDANARKKLAEDEAEDAKAAVLAALGDAEGGESEIGRVTYLETKRRAYSVAESSYRTLRFKAAK